MSAPQPVALVVDDDPIARFLAMEAAASAGCRVVEVCDGAAAIEEFARSAADLVLLDVVMEGMDGYETCQALRALPGGDNAAILMMTGLDDVASVNRAYSAGATDFVTKPINPAVLSYRILSLLRARRATQELAVATERARFSDALEKSLALADALQEAVPEGILVVGEDGRVLRFNRYFVTLWGLDPEPLVDTHLDEVLDQVATRLSHPDDHLELRRAQTRVDPASSRGELRLLDERVFEYQVAPVVKNDGGGAVFGNVWLVRDVTARRRLEVDRLALADRMASLGRLAAGVAHEINNPLAFVMANIDWLAGTEEVGADAERDSVFADTRAGLERIRQIVREVQALSRPQDGQAWVDLRQPLELSIQMATSAFRHKARLVRHYGPVPLVLANEVRLGQVFLNLIMNAAAAIPERSGRDHEIAVALGTDVAGGVFVEVRDTGVGIRPDQLARVFDPFFTTKEAGRGTGLGLAVSREIVEAHGGKISVESPPGQGATFRVALPLSSRGSRPPPLQTRPAAGGRRGRILVIDDEVAVLDSVCRLLRSRHEVVGYSNAQEALSAIDGGHFDAVLCDLMMPGATGADVFAGISQKAPDLAKKLAFISGGAFTDQMRDFLAGVQNPCLAKPFSAHELHALVDRLVSAPVPAG